MFITKKCTKFSTQYYLNSIPNRLYESSDEVSPSPHDRTAVPADHSKDSKPVHSHHHQGDYSVQFWVEYQSNHSANCFNFNSILSCSEVTSSRPLSTNINFNSSSVVAPTIRGNSLFFNKFFTSTDSAINSRGTGRIGPANILLKF